MLDDRQSFKAGFLARCADDGLTPAEAQDRAVKTSALLEKASSVAGTAAGLGLLGLTLAVGAPVAAGGLTGLLGAKATDVDDTDVEDVKRRELAEELLRQTAHVRNETTAREGLALRKPGGRGRP